jgi:hypothetical protein
LDVTPKPSLPYEHAIALTRQAPERRFLERRLAELTGESES